MKSEAEARKCWCPFARLVGLDAQPAWNRAKDDDGNVFLSKGTQCIASECMAWRWAQEIDETGKMNTAYRKTPIKDSPGHFDNAPLGYCGLAGKQ